MNITTVILTKNEEANIVNRIESVKDLGDVIIVDDNSSDHTVEVVKSFKSKKVQLYERDLNNDFSAQRNFAIEKCKTDWILFLDADEELSSTLKENIRRVVNSDSKYDGYKIKRVDIFGGKKLKFGETKNIRLTRLGRKGRGEWTGKVHEIWKIKNVAFIQGDLLHTSHTQISEFLSEINYYSTLRANELYEQGIKVGLLGIIAFPIGKFSYNYFIKLGFFDGIQGFVMSVFMSLYSFLVRGKLYLIYNNENKER